MNDEQSRSEFIAALRKVASTLESHPGLTIPYFGTQVIHCNSVDDFRRNVEAYGGHWDKQSTDGDFQMTSKLHSNLSLMLYASHSKVCERVVVGVKHIPETVLPAQPERVVPARDEEVVKWVCPPILATETEQAVDAVLREPETPDGVVGL